MAARPLIEIQQACKSFDQGKSFVVRDVSLDVPAGSLVALLGATGSGKTTLVKMINRLIQPDSGDVKIEGIDVSAIDAPTLRRGIGYVFQGVGLFPHMSIAENIGITPLLLGWRPEQIAARVRELLDLVALPQSYATRSPTMLSGGEKQRAAIARAIAARPRIVLMDEPFGALDPITRDAIGSAYRRLHETLALTTVMVTHDVQEALLLADRIAVMKSGRILAYDTPKALMTAATQPDVSALLDMPRHWAERIRSLMDFDQEPRAHE